MGCVYVKVFCNLPGAVLGEGVVPVLPVEKSEEEEWGLPFAGRLAPVPLLSSCITGAVPGPSVEEE